MSVCIDLVRATPTGKYWKEWVDNEYQVYDAVSFKWFKDYTNNKSFVRGNDWDYVEDDFYGLCKPKDFRKIKKYIKENMDGGYKLQYYQAISKIENNEDVYFMISQ